jgi:hypothetical protein
MYVRMSAVAMVCVLLSLSGCGGGDDADTTPTVTTQIISDPAFDGDIEQTAPSSFTVTQGMSSNVQSVLVGIDPAGGTEFRTFLDFPLGGSRGVPQNAFIDEAFLEIYVDSLEPTTTKLPLRVDLVAFQPPSLIETDFSRSLQPALASVVLSQDISRSDVGTFVSIDVTPLMVEAQRRGLVDFQVRILEDIGPAIPVLMVIDDSTGVNRGTRAPVLTVTYF